MRGDPVEIAPGKWRFRLSLGPDPLKPGKYRQETRTVEAKNITTARKLRNAALAEVGKGSAPAGETVGWLIDRYLEHCTYMGREPSTMAGYKYVANAWRSEMANVPLSSLMQDRHRIKATYQRWADSGRSRTTVDHRHRFLNAAFAYAITEGWVQANPVTGVKRPPAHKGKKEAISEDEVQQLLTASETIGPEAKALTWLATDTWARPGELCAVRWNRISLDDASVYIDAAIDSVVKHRRKDTKTHQVRLLSIAPSTAQLLAEYREWCEAQAGKARETPGLYLFSSDLGANPWRPSRAAQIFRRVAKLAGVRKPGAPTWATLYDLRHAGATHGLANGLDLAQVSFRMGHQRMSTTADNYAHAIPDRDRKTAELMERTFRRQVASPTLKS